MASGVVDKNLHPLQKGQRVVFDPMIGCSSDKDRTYNGILEEVSNIAVPIVPGAKQLVKWVTVVTTLRIPVIVEAPVCPLYVTHDPEPEAKPSGDTAEVQSRKEEPPKSNILEIASR